jgi:cytosine/adenosine deaminase-related metal-dependent hydrolase
MSDVSQILQSHRLDSSYTLRARWVFPVASPPVEGGVVTVNDGRIVAVGPHATEGQAVDLGDVAILPGLVNAHTHLEFSELEQPLGEPGMSFPRWIREVIAWRLRREEEETQAPSRRRLAITRGLEASAAHGVAALGEIAAPGWPEEPFLETSLDCTVFQELLGLAPERQPSLLQLAENHWAAGQHPDSQRRGGTWRAAFSPHAPYTAPPALVEQVAELSQRTGAPVAMHLAESWEELELLQSRSGPFAEFLAELSPVFPNLIPRGIRPQDYLERLARAARALVIHGNYLDEEEIAFLAEHAERMSVVYCPRTHAYFRHGRYPLEALLAQGVHVAIGTDSLASNPDLNLWNELRFIAQHYPSVAPETVLHLGTQAGADALGIADEYGVLAVGRAAAFSFVPLEACSADDPHELLFRSAAAESETV